MHNVWLFIRVITPSSLKRVDRLPKTHLKHIFCRNSHKYIILHICWSRFFNHCTKYKCNIDLNISSLQPVSFFLFQNVITIKMLIVWVFQIDCKSNEHMCILGKKRATGSKLSEHHWRWFRDFYSQRVRLETRTGAKTSFHRPSGEGWNSISPVNVWGLTPGLSLTRHTL